MSGDGTTYVIWHHDAPMQCCSFLNIFLDVVEMLLTSSFNNYMFFQLWIVVSPYLQWRDTASRPIYNCDTAISRDFFLGKYNLYRGGGSKCLVQACPPARHPGPPLGRILSDRRKPTAVAISYDRSAACVTISN